MPIVSDVGRLGSAPISNILEELTSLGDNPDHVAFWTGAGISMPWPTCAPSGPSLTHMALTSYFTADSSCRLSSLYKELELTNAGRPRLETILDVVVENFGADGLVPLLSSLGNADPNHYHSFLAQHARAGGRQVTTNFDTCVERSGVPEGAVVHAHGAFDPASVSSLGATLSVIRRGIPDGLAAEIDDVLSNCRLLVFIGYSGSDFFDIDPFLRSRHQLLSRTRLVVHDYRANEDLNAVAIAPGDRASSTFLEGVVDEVVVTSGALSHLLNLLCMTWGFEDVIEQGGPCTEQSPIVGVGDQEKWAATLELYARMGYRSGVIDLARRAGQLRSKERDYVADALWGRGRYREALGHWRLAYRDDRTVGAQAALAEREAAVAWIRGQMLRAERKLWRGLQRFGLDNSVPLETRARMMETYLLVNGQMKRLPDVRWLCRPRRAAHVHDQLAVLEQQVDVAAPMFRAKISAVRGDQIRLPSASRLAAQSEFDQEEALHAWANFRQGTLRRRVEVDNGPSITHDEIECLLRDQLAIGAMADAARVALLPGAMQVMSLARAWSLWRDVDITPYHRFRVFAGLALRRWVGLVKSRRVTRS